MRTRFAILLAALLLAPLSLQPASAADRGIGVPAPAGPGAAPGPRGLAESALGRAEALFEDGSRTARRQPAGHGRDASMVLNELVRRRGDLSTADRARADAILARPTDGTGGAVGDTYTVPEATPHCGDNVCIHYVTSTADAPLLTDGDGDTIPDSVEQALTTAESVNDTYVGAGYRRPDPDGTLGGGSGLVDIYLVDLGDKGLYGYCTTDQPDKDNGTWNYWAYCAIDDDFSSAQFPTNTPVENQQVTLAHEYFHAVQYAYDAGEDPWFLEGTATWVEDELFDAVDDNHGYLPAGQLGAPNLPLDAFQSGSSAHYGNWAFFRYLTERWPAETGGMPTLMLELMESVSARGGSDPDRYSTDAIRHALARRGASFTSVYGQFADANRRPDNVYDEGAAYPVARPARTVQLDGGKRGVAHEFRRRLDHLTSSTTRFTPGAGTRHRRTKLRITVDLPTAKSAPAARVLVFLKDGTVQSSSIRLDRQTRGSAVVGFSSRQVRYVELVLVNASLRTECWSSFSEPFSACYGTPRDDFVRTDYSAGVVRR